MELHLNTYGESLLKNYNSVKEFSVNIKPLKFPYLSLWIITEIRFCNFVLLTFLNLLKLVHWWQHHICLKRCGLIWYTEVYMGKKWSKTYFPSLFLASLMIQLVKISADIQDFLLNLLTRQDLESIRQKPLKTMSIRVPKTLLPKAWA